MSDPADRDFVQLANALEWACKKSKESVRVAYVHSYPTAQGTRYAVTAEPRHEGCEMVASIAAGLQ